MRHALTGPFLALTLSACTTAQMHAELAAYDDGYAPGEDYWMMTDQVRQAQAALNEGGALFGAVVPEAVRVCREAIVKEAAQFGALSVDVFSAGEVRESNTSGQIAPLTVLIVYPGDVREAPVECHLDANGTVVAVEAA